MQPEERDPAYLWDMLAAAKDVRAFIAGMKFRDYEQNKLVQAAVEPKIEVIGEAARNVSRPFREQHPAIPWKGIIAQRNVLAHDYGEIKQEKLWRVANDYIPELISQVEPIVARLH